MSRDSPRPALGGAVWPLALPSLLIFLSMRAGVPAAPAVKHVGAASAQAQERALPLFIPVALNDSALAEHPAPAPSASPTMSPAFPTPGATASATPTVPPTPGTVLTRSGPVSGVLEGDVWHYLGIPYAQPPIGLLRWRPPEPAAPWTEPLYADAFGPACPQYDDSGAVIGDEDCLTLNVWTYSDPVGGDRARPVLLFIHGGGHVQGSASTMAGDRPLYDGQALAQEHDLVVVTINYRLGPFGFLAHPALTAEGGATASGNYGALDQLAAMRWVHDNIASFGGDPGNVTVFGQSAGSVSTCRLVVSPLARGLLQRAVLMSGACVATSLQKAENNGLDVARELGCPAGDVPACLRARTMEDVMATLEPGVSGPDTLGQNSYDGVIDGYLLPDAPRTLIEERSHNAMPVMIGTTSAENGRDAPAIGTESEYEAAVRAYVVRSGLPASVADRALAVYPVANYATPRDAYVALTSDVKFVCQARTDARLLADNQGPPVFRYLFDHIPDNGGSQAQYVGAFHGLDLVYLFGVLEVGVGRLRYHPGADDVAVSDAMESYWARFASAGDPNGGDGTPWPTYAPDTDPYLRVAAPEAAEQGLHSAQCDFWDSLAGR